MSDEAPYEESPSEKPDKPAGRPEPEDGKSRKDPFWKPTEADKRRWSSTFSGLGGISIIVSLVGLYAHTSVAIVLWSAVAVLLLVGATLAVRLTENRPVELPLLAGVIGVLVVACLAAGGIYSYVSRPPARPVVASTAPATSTTTLVPASPDTSPSSVAPPIRHQGILVLLGNGATSYDLDSTASNWGAAEGSWLWQNMQYFPNDGSGQPELAIANAPASDVLLGTSGHWTYQDCANADYIGYSDPDYSKNDTVGSAVYPGHGICVLTFNNTATKTDGGHYALLVVLARTPVTLTLQITVWQ